MLAIGYAKNDQDDNKGKVVLKVLPATVCKLFANYRMKRPVCYVIAGSVRGLSIQRLVGLMSEPSIRTNGFN